MTAVRAGARTPAEALLSKGTHARRRERVDRLMTALLWLSVAVALAPLVAIMVVVVQKGASAMNWEFLTSVSPFSFRRSGGGYLQGFVGTAYMVGVATVLSVPTGILAAVFLVEYRTNRLVGPVRFFSDVMTGVPSVFVGLFVYAAMVRGANLGFGTLVGAISLAILMLPIVVRSSEEILKLVPQDLRNGALALGARKWQTTLRTVLPAAAPGLVTGSMLAVARAAGETAPLILTALGSVEIVTALQNGTGQSALSLLIFDGARNPFAAGQARAWAGALELILLVLVLTFIARLIIARRNRNARP